MICSPRRPGRGGADTRPKVLIFFHGGQGGWGLFPRRPGETVSGPRAYKRGGGISIGKKNICPEMGGGRKRGPCQAKKMGGGGGTNCHNKKKLPPKGEKNDKRPMLGGTGSENHPGWAGRAPEGPAPLPFFMPGGENLFFSTRPGGRPPSICFLKGSKTRGFFGPPPPTPGENPRHPTDPGGRGGHGRGCGFPGGRRQKRGGGADPKKTGRWGPEPSKPRGFAGGRVSKNTKKNWGGLLGERTIIFRAGGGAVPNPITWGGLGAGTEKGFIGGGGGGPGGPDLYFSRCWEGVSAPRGRGKRFFFSPTRGETRGAGGPAPNFFPPKRGAQQNNLRPFFSAGGGFPERAFSPPKQTSFFFFGGAIF